jgi:hypothetical protein
LKEYCLLALNEPATTGHIVDRVEVKLDLTTCAGLGNQCCDVVLVKGALTWEKPQGVGVSEWETDEEQMGSRWGGMEMERSVYKQPGTRVDGSYCSKEGSK